MTEPQIKRYRRKVDDARVERVVAVVTKQHPVRHDFCQMDYTMVSEFNQLPEYLKDRERKRVRAALESDAEVMDVITITKWHDFVDSMVTIELPDGAVTMTEVEFYAEWEEIL